MRQRAWIGLGLGAAAVLVAALAAGVPPGAGRDALFLVAGGLLLAAVAILASLATFWRHALPPLPPMERLFVRPRAGQRWCGRCGRPAPGKGPCPSCGTAAARERRAQRRLQRKQGARSQEKKT